MRPADRGMVWFLGGGPGTPDLLTVRAARALGEADVVVWGASLPADAVVAEFAPPDAERVPRGDDGPVHGRQARRGAAERPAAGRLSARDACAIAHRVTRDDEQVVTCRLDELATTILGREIERHTLVIVGPAAGGRDEAAPGS